MLMWRNLVAGLRALFRKDAVEGEMDEELCSYLEAAEKEKMRSGMSAEEAKRAARVEVGSLEAVKEEMRSVGWEARVETLWQDLRYGLRMMRKNLGFTAVAVLTLAVGIGANATVFSMVNQVLFKPLRYVNPDGLLIVWEKPMKEGRREVAAQTYLDWRDRNTAFEQLAAGLPTTLTFTGDPPTFVSGAQVTQNFFDAFRLHSEAGRLLIPAEFQPGTQRVAVISHELWQSKLGAQSGIIGQPLRLNGESYRVVGVMPAGFEFLARVDVWTPLVFTPERLNRRFRNLVVVGRLKPGVTSAQAQQEMNGIAARIAQESPLTNQGWGAEVQDIREALLGPGVRLLMLMLLVVVGAVLLMACANVANVQLARGAARRKEIAVKMALGAHRLRLVRQLLAESFLIAALGGAFGLLLADWVVSYLATLPVMQAPGAARLHMDGVALAFVAGLCVICAMFQASLPPGRSPNPTCWRTSRLRAGPPWVKPAKPGSTMASLSGNLHSPSCCSSLQSWERGVSSTWPIPIRVSLLKVY